MCMCVCIFAENPSYPSEDSQMLSSLLKSRLGSRSWGNSSSSLSSWSLAAPLLSSTPLMTGTSGRTVGDSRLCWLLEASVSSAPSSLWVKVSARASACGSIKRDRNEPQAGVSAALCMSVCLKDVSEKNGCLKIKTANKELHPHVKLLSEVLFA